ncbi:MAG TPA: SpoIIIAH-like family protein [Clostridia bacterium]|nr:SpoIIIAH-like family protein [Clostridia bacterium]
MKNWKKYLTLGVVALLLVGAVYMNIKLSGKTDIPADTESVDAKGDADIDALNGETDYFETYRADRDSRHELEYKYLDEAIETSASDAETLKDAQEAKLALVDTIEKEFTMESLIKAKGFEDAAVMYSKGSVDVVVKAAVLEPTEVAQILSIVMEQTGESAGNINIVPYG